MLSGGYAVFAGGPSGHVPAHALPGSYHLPHSLMRKPLNTSLAPAVTLTMPWLGGGPFSVSQGALVACDVPALGSAPVGDCGLCRWPAVLALAPLVRSLEQRPRLPPLQVAAKLLSGERPEVPPLDQLPGTDTRTFAGLEGYIALMRWVLMPFCADASVKTVDQLACGLVCLASLDPRGSRNRLGSAASEPCVACLASHLAAPPSLSPHYLAPGGAGRSSPASGLALRRWFPSCAGWWACVANSPGRQCRS